VWRIVNRERKRWKRVNKRIEVKEWREHFMTLLGGVEGRVLRKGGKGGWRMGSKSWGGVR